MIESNIGATTIFCWVSRAQPNLRVIILLNNTEGGTLWLKSLGVLLLMRPLMKCGQKYETLMPCPIRRSCIYR